MSAKPKTKATAARGSHQRQVSPRRTIKNTFYGLTCSRCALMFACEEEAEDHINEPMCQEYPKRANAELTDGGTNEH